MRGVMHRLKDQARRLKREIAAVALAARDLRTPWPARLLALAVVAYALSPIDLIPDVIPVLGYLDDLLIVPAGLWLALRLIPDDVLAECRAQTARQDAGDRAGRAGAVVVLLIWAALASGLATWTLRRM